MGTNPGQVERRGTWLGVAAYGIWGLFPLYWPLLKPAGSLEILAHRITWTVVMMVILHSFRGTWPEVRRVLADLRKTVLLIAAGVLIAGNWGIYIWAVNVNRVVDASLGYFITPLVNVAFGVAFLRERPRPMVWVAIGIGSAAILIMASENGEVPWLGLSLALTFGSYGLIKKVVALQTAVGLTLETAVVALPAAAYLVWLQTRGGLVFAHHSFGQSAFSVLAGPITAIPLLLFGAAATRVNLSTLGLLQYLTPILQFLIGLTVFHEAMSGGRWAGFLIVWVALVLYTIDNVRVSRQGGVVSLPELD